MPDDREIWRSAQQMLDRFGDDALIEVNKRIDELKELDEIEAHAVWVRIRTATKTLVESRNQKRKQ